MRNKQSQQKACHDQRAQERQFFVEQTVMARNLRPGADWVPAVVVERLGPLSYLVETSDKLLWRRHMDLLRELEIRNRDAELQDPNTPDLDVPDGDPLSPPQPVVFPTPVAPPARPESPVTEASSVLSLLTHPIRPCQHRLPSSFRNSIRLGLTKVQTGWVGDWWDLILVGRGVVY